MRKGQQQILEKAKKNNLPQIYIDYLGNSAKSLEELRYCSLFFHTRHRHNIEASEEDFRLLESVDVNTLGFCHPSWAYYNIGLFTNEIVHQVCGLPEDIRFFVLEIMRYNDISFQDAVTLAGKLKGDNVFDMKTYPGVLYDILTHVTHKGRKKTDDASNYDVNEKVRLAEIVYELSEQEDYYKLRKKVFEIIDNHLPAEKLEEWHKSNELARQNKPVVMDMLENTDYYSVNDYKVYDVGDSLEVLENIVNYLHFRQLPFEVSNISIECSATAYMYSVSENAVSVKLHKIKKCRYYVDTYKGGCYEYDYSKRASGGYIEYLYFFDSGALYYEKNRRVSIDKLRKDIQLFGRPFENFINTIMDFHIRKGETVFRDVKRLMDDSRTYMPVYWHECIGKHTMADVCADKYKKNIPVLWNKGDISINYCFYMVYEMVKEDSRGILYNEYRAICQNPEKFYENLYRFVDYDLSRKEVIIHFLAYLLYNRLGMESYWLQENEELASDEDVYILCLDYIKMSRQMKQKVKLKFCSAKKVKVAHDDLAIAQRNDYKNVPNVKVPKGSKFAYLRKILPDEFVWVKTKRRLIYEGMQMHHCVANYASAVNADSCAIYSFVYKPTGKRYTIEFVRDSKNLYCINQMQGRYNRGCPEEVRAYVQEFLDSYNSRYPCEKVVECD